MCAICGVVFFFTLYLKLQGENYHLFLFNMLYFLLQNCKTIVSALHEEESLCLSPAKIGCITHFMMIFT